MIVRGRAVGVKRDDNYDNAEKTADDADDADADNLRCLIIITQFTRINATETSNAGGTGCSARSTKVCSSASLRVIRVCV